jgi:hypothetical protein
MKQLSWPVRALIWLTLWGSILFMLQVVKTTKVFIFPLTALAAWVFIEAVCKKAAESSSSDID